MNKKPLLLTIFSTFLFSFFAINVYAQETGLKKAFGLITSTVGAILGMFTESPEVWIKVLFGIALFTALFYGGKTIFDSKTSGILAFIFALMVVIILPGTYLMYIVQTYAALFMALVILLPFGALAVITYTVPKNRWVYAGLAGIWIVFLFILTTMMSSLEKIEKAGAAISASTAFLYNVILVVAIILIFVLILFAIFKGGAAAGKAVAGKAVPRRVKKLLSKADRILSGEKRLEVIEMKFLKEALSELESGNNDAALSHLKDIRSIGVREMVIDSALDKYERKIESLEEKHKKRLSARLDGIVNELKPIFNMMRIKVRDAERAIKKDTIDKAKKGIQIAINLDLKALVLTRKLQALEQDLEKY